MKIKNFLVWLMLMFFVTACSGSNPTVTFEKLDWDKVESIQADFVMTNGRVNFRKPDPSTLSWPIMDLNVSEYNKGNFNLYLDTSQITTDLPEGLGIHDFLHGDLVILIQPKSVTEYAKAEKRFFPISGRIYISLPLPIEKTLYWLYVRKPDGTEVSFKARVRAVTPNSLKFLISGVNSFSLEPISVSASPSPSPSP
ncbi:MAG: hypothetical protein AAB870_05145 [Patescibacteria group bacterium]|mgnify:CR=1 FL=1